MSWRIRPDPARRGEYKVEKDDQESPEPWIVILVVGTFLFVISWLVYNVYVVIPHEKEQTAQFPTNK